MLLSLLHLGMGLDRDILHLAAVRHRMHLAVHLLNSHSVRLVRKSNDNHGM